MNEHSDREYLVKIYEHVLVTKKNVTFLVIALLLSWAVSCIAALFL
jgi:hypothetical protein